MGNITFKRLQKSEYSSFSNEAITIFSIAVAETFGETMDNDNDIESSLNNPDSEVFAVYEIQQIPSLPQNYYFCEVSPQQKQGISYQKRLDRSHQNGIENQKQ